MVCLPYLARCVRVKIIIFISIKAEKTHALLIASSMDAISAATTAKLNFHKFFKGPGN